MHSSRPSCLPVPALLLAALGTMLLAAAAPLRADELSLHGGVGSSLAVPERASAAGSPPPRSLLDTRAVQPAPELAAFGGARLAPGLVLEDARTSFVAVVPPGDTLVGYSAERAALWSISSVGSVPLDSSVSLLARFGLHNLEGQNQFASPAQVDELGRVYGLGLQFAPSECVDLRAEVQRRTRVGSDGSSDASAMLFTAQVRF